MIKKIAYGAILLFLVLIVIACSSPTSPSVTAPNPVQSPASTPASVQPPTSAPTATTTPSIPKPSGPIKDVDIPVMVSGSTVSISLSDVKNNWNTKFEITKGGTTYNFMAYIFEGKIHVRGDVCPPCRSIGYTLDNDTLVCNTCRTTFKASNGDGIRGACVKYPKAAVAYKIVNDNIVMNQTDLIDAYQETLKIG